VPTRIEANKIGCSRSRKHAKQEELTAATAVVLAVNFQQLQQQQQQHQQQQQLQQLHQQAQHNMRCWALFTHHPQ